MMAKQFAKAINSGGFHLKIANAMIADIKPRKFGNEVRLGKANAQHAALRTIETGAGDRDAVLVAFDKMFYEGWRCAADIRQCNVACDLSLGDACLQDLVLFVRRFVAVKIEEVVYAKSMC